MHPALSELGAYVRAVIMGHVRYYGVPLNSPAICAFAKAVNRLWWRTLRRRSQRRFRGTWTQFAAGASWGE